MQIPLLPWKGWTTQDLQRSPSKQQRRAPCPLMVCTARRRLRGSSRAASWAAWTASLPRLPQLLASLTSWATPLQRRPRALASQVRSHTTAT